MFFGADICPFTTHLASRVSLGGKVTPLTQTIPPEYRSRIALIKIDDECAPSPIIGELIDKIEHDPTGIKILVEMANDQSEREAFLDRMKSLGFNAYAIPNNYDENYCLSLTKPIVPIKNVALPAVHIDVVFSRGALGTGSKERMR